MPLSTVTKETKAAIRKCGYSVLTLALNQLVKNGHYNLAAMIMVALCLAPRKTEVENNGTLAVLKNVPLHQKTVARDNPLKRELKHLALHSPNYDRIMAALVVTGWWESYDAFPRHTDPLLISDDKMLLYTPAGQPGCAIGPQVELCDLACCQHERYFDHTRLIWDGNYPLGGAHPVRVIGKQMDRWEHKMGRMCTKLPNGYYEYQIPADTVIHRMRDDLCGRTLAEIMEPGVWYNVYFRPDAPLDLVDHEAEKQLAAARQNIANLVMKAGALNG